MKSVLSLSFVLLLISFAMYRRMLPQPVRPRGAAVLSAIIVIVSALSLIGSNRLTEYPLSVMLALPALVVGIAGGLVLARSISFWRDTATDVLWMKGGIVYLTVWLAAEILRQVIAYSTGAYGSGGTAGQSPVNPSLAVLATDLIIVSIGLWIARAAALTLKYRDYERATAAAR